MNMNKAPSTDRPTVDLSRFSTAGFDRGAGVIKEALWLIVRKLIFEHLPGRWYGLKRALLRAFGAKIGRGVVVKPGAIITHPWNLEVGDHVWIGEEDWLLSLDKIILEDHVALAHRVFLATGNHDYTSETFELKTSPIRVCSGAWLTSGTMVGPGVTVGAGAVLTMGSVATDDLEPWSIHRGNPAQKIGERKIRSPKP